MSYWHPDCARSLAEHGVPRELPASAGWVLQRPIDGFPYADALGCYPLSTGGNRVARAGDLKGLLQKPSGLLALAEAQMVYTIARFAGGSLFP
jgi:hypothetical protein